MPDKKQILPEDHRKQIEAYVKELPRYEVYAEALKRVLCKACGMSAPEAFVQARPKSVSSFAEKVARKFEKYPDAVHQLTDLCGARVIVQTLEQVHAVRQFIEANFMIVEKDDKTLSLREDVFGYRDMHYIVRLKTGRELGFSSEELATISDRRAEIQVRTWVQHAWADTLHDRLYKTKLRFSPEVRRVSALLAAIMEDGDRTFDRLAHEVDGMLANYTAHANREDVEREIDVLSVVLANEPSTARRPALAMHLAQLIASAKGEYAQVIKLLEPHSGAKEPLRRELLVELGFALCKQHRANWRSDDYRRGQKLLEEAVTLGERQDVTAVPNLRKERSLQARALARLGWSWECVEEGEQKALDCYRKALEGEPSNPYYLADILGFEISCTRNTELTASTRITVIQAIRSCEKHARADIEMPYACFTAGRLSLLLGNDDAAVAWYTRGLRHCHSKTACVPHDVGDNELAFLRRIHAGKTPPPAHEWINGLMQLAQTVCNPSTEATERVKRMASPYPLPLKTPVLFVVGGAATLPNGQIAEVQKNLAALLEPFAGTVISGGTTSGVPGCVGMAAAEIAARGRKQFQLVGYIPQKLPHDAVKDGHYDHIEVGKDDGFCAGQILQSWADLLAAGIKPTEVLMLGFGGGPLSALEYRIALALGATVGVVMASGGAADELVADPLWKADLNLLPLPADAQTLRAFVLPSNHTFPPKVMEEMGQEFHRRYVADSPGNLPENMRPWEKLSDNYRNANLEQARYAIFILEAAGFGVRKAAAKPVLFADFRESELERMAELEHGRWNVERLRGGWRYGESRDNARKIHNLIVPWDRVPSETRKYDLEAIRIFPQILAKAGLEVYRK